MPGFLSPPDLNPTAWIIDKDLLFAPGDDPSENEAGTTGPSDAPDALITRLKEDTNAGRAFRMYDDDGEHYYTGRILVFENDVENDGHRDMGEEFFRPLWDFGTPNAGATDIRYRNKHTGVWVGL